MTEKKDRGEGAGEDVFLGWAAGTRPIKGAGNHVSRRSNSALEINLRHSADDTLAHAHRSGKVAKSARQVDARTERRIKQGKIRPEGRLDLHGYRYDAARVALRRFVAQAVEQEKRCLLLVTGKGDMGAGTPEAPARGIIRRAVPDWLNESPLNHMVLRAEPAKPEDGGAGALYLYLRRTR